MRLLRRKRQDAKARHALIGSDAVNRGLTGECALSVLQIAVMRPTRYVVLALECDGAWHGHRSGAARRRGRGLSRRGHRRLTIWSSLRRRGLPVRSGGWRVLLGIRLLPVGWLRRRISRRRVTLRVPLLGIASCGRGWRLRIVLLFGARAEDDEQNDEGATRQRRFHTLGLLGPG
jgi:hypothetical protein